MISNKEEIFKQIADTLSSMFEIPRQNITLQSKLYEDLDIDSIDAIDLLVKLQAMLGKRISPDDFKSARTVQDVVDTVYRLACPSGDSVT